MIPLIDVCPLRIGAQHDQWNLSADQRQRLAQYLKAHLVLTALCGSNDVINRI